MRKMRSNSSPSSASFSKHRTNNMASSGSMSGKSNVPNKDLLSKDPAVTGEPTLANGGQNNIKRDIACGPGSVREFFYMFFLGCSRKILGVKAELKLAIYLIVVFLGSLFAELFGERMMMEKDVFLQRLARPLNSFVIRFGYGWVLILTFPLILLTARVYSRNNNVTIFANFGRIVFNTMAWFLTTSAFFWYYSAKGMCVSLSQSNATHTTLKNLLFGDCKRAGFQWSGFDISGHTFLLVFCNLILLEEAKVMKLVDRCLQQAQQQSISSVQDEVVNSTPSSGSLISKRDKLILQGVLCACGVTCVAYDYLLFVTVFYYHTILEKMLAFIIAACCWYVFYRVMYPRMAIQPGSNPGAQIQQSHNL